MSDEKKSFVRNELKWISIVVAFTASVLFNYFAVTKSVNMNTYRITEIEKDRAFKWSNYEECTEERNELLRSISLDIAVIKTKLEIENGAHRKFGG